MLARNVAILAEYQLRAGRLERPVSASARLNAWPRRPRKRISSPKSSGCEAASGKARVTTTRPASVSSEQLRGHAISRRGCSSCTLPATLSGLAPTQAARPRRLRKRAASWTGSRRISTFLFSPNVVQCCNRPSQSRMLQNTRDVPSPFPLGRIVTAKKPRKGTMARYARASLTMPDGRNWRGSLSSGH